MTVKRWLCLPLVMMWALVACGSTTTAPSWFVRDYAGIPPGFVQPSPSTPVALRLQVEDGSAVWAAGDEMAVVTWWSSGCPKIPVDLEATGNALAVTLSSGTSPYGGACTADDAPHTSLIRVPKSVDKTRQVSITFIDGGRRWNQVLAPRPASS